MCVFFYFCFLGTGGGGILINVGLPKDNSSIQDLSLLANKTSREENKLAEVKFSKIILFIFLQKRI